MSQVPDHEIKTPKGSNPRFFQSPKKFLISSIFSNLNSETSNSETDLTKKLFWYILHKNRGITGKCGGCCQNTH